MDQRTSGTAALLTIGELAEFVGVTIRAVRHYHSRGLLPEPVRDSSGYRRYGGRAVVDLIRIKTLADAGVPLARVGELLEAGPDEFAAALDEIDERLEREAAEIAGHRQRIGELLDGESLGHPPEVMELVERMRELGLSDRIIEMEREGWLVIAAHSPDEVSAMIPHKLAMLDDPDALALYHAFDQAAGWEADDPRLEGVADLLADLLDREEHTMDQAGPEADLDPTLMDFLDSQAMAAVPAFRGIRTLLEARGWAGWTNFTRQRRSPPLTGSEVPRSED